MKKQITPPQIFSHLFKTINYKWAVTFLEICDFSRNSGAQKHLYLGMSNVIGSFFFFYPYTFFKYNLHIKMFFSDFEI